MDEKFEEYEKYTTLMYRSPEMVDQYKKWDVTTKVDIWMLGCVAFTLVCGQHPFQEEQKLSIINAQYQFPDKKPLSEKCKDFIRWLLTPEPSYRPNIMHVLSVLDNWQNAKINLPPCTQIIKQRQEHQTE
jgi:serine/threonine protein kinase